MLNKTNQALTPLSHASEVAARCHEIQTGLGLTEVADFDSLRTIGMAVRMALHIRGLPPINYYVLRLVSTHFLNIPAIVVQTVVMLLDEIEFVKLQTEGKSIKVVVPNVPYYETLYETVGVYALDTGFNEAEQLSIELLSRLSRSPEKIDVLESTLGAEVRQIRRAFDLGKSGSYLRVHRSRGRDIALSPTYFSENAEVYADAVAGGGANQVQKVLAAIRSRQGMPLSVVLDRKEIAGVSLSTEDLNMVRRLAQDGSVKPPSIKTSYSGDQFFLFTPTPSGAALAPTKRDIYEKAMAVVAAMRQGQFLPQRYAIRSPAAVLNALRSNLKLGRATTEATQQYKNLVMLRVAHLIDVGGGFSELRIIDTEENREALDIAYELVDGGVTSGMEVGDAAREALQNSQEYVESLVASGELQRHENVAITQDQQLQLDYLLNY